MRFILFAIAATLLSAACLPAAAQQSEIWTDPEGRYTLTPSVAGAHLLDGDAPRTTASFRIGANTVRVRMCSVRDARRFPNSESATQSALNEYLSAMMGPERELPPGEPVLTHRRSFERAGVMIFAWRVETERGVWRYRQFALASPQGATLHEISCGGTPPVTAEEEAAFEAFLDSIRFTP